MKIEREVGTDSEGKERWRVRGVRVAGRSFREDVFRGKGINHIEKVSLDWHSFRGRGKILS